MVVEIIQYQYVNGVMVTECVIIILFQIRIFIIVMGLAIVSGVEVMVGCSLFRAPRVQMAGL